MAGAGVLFAMSHAPLPKPRELAATTILTDVHGTRLASLDSGEDRVPVKLETIPDIVVDAIVVTEDRHFFRHGGLDPAGIMRATWADLRGRPLQGGSTITQQLVKNLYLGRERTIWRKLKEASLAIKVERNYDKREILERYLNTVYFGRGAYGVQAAARAYFNKDVADVDVNEAAYLAGLIRAPELADPNKNFDVATSRRDVALRAMRRNRIITRKAAEDAQKVKVTDFVLDRRAQEPSVARTDKGTQYFVDYVQRELVRRYGPDATYEGGLRVKTSIDLNLQAKAYDAVYGFLDRPEDPAGALVAVDDQGRIRAMVGGRGFATSKVNLAVGAEGGGSGRQAGSTFKPFVLAAIVNDGFSIQSTFPAPKEVILPKADNGKDYPVTNYEDQEFGDSLDLIKATANSVNTVYVQAQLAIGAEKVVEMAKAAGIRSELEPNASLTLGTEEVSVLELAGAFSTFANRGLRKDPQAILEIKRADGSVILGERPAPEARVMDRPKADVVNHVLQQVVQAGSGTAAKLAGVEVAGKTGTTQDFGDAWFAGYTPKLTAVVWMGYPEGNTRKMTRVRGQKVTGGLYPAQIWKRFMAEVVKDAAYTGDFPELPGLRTKPLRLTKKVVIPTTTTTAPPASATTTTAPPGQAPAAPTTTTAAPPPPG